MRFASSWASRLREVSTTSAFVCSPSAMRSMERSSSAVISAWVMCGANLSRASMTAMPSCEGSMGSFCTYFTW